MSRQLEEFDLITTDGFEELYNLVKVLGIELCDDTVVVLFRRLFADYSPGTWDNRNAIKRLVTLIRIRDRVQA